MTLGELIAHLASRNPATVVKDGFGSGHSDRGDYCNAAFTPLKTTTFGSMLGHANNLLDTTQVGYKGGEFFMGSYVEVFIGEWGLCGEPINLFNFLYWEASAAPAPEVPEVPAPLQAGPFRTHLAVLDAQAAYDAAFQEVARLADASTAAQDAAAAAVTAHTTAILNLGSASRAIARATELDNLLASLPDAESRP